VNAPPLHCTALPRLHVVTDDRVLSREGWAAHAEAVIETGGAEICLHLRGPGTAGAALHRLAEALLAAARRAGALLFVNDRIDVALAADLDGVHLGARSLPVGIARPLVGQERRVGVSCHGAAEVSRGKHEGADYAFVGTIFPTPSHPGIPGLGIEGLEAISKGARGFPVVGIGGIDSARVAQVMQAGAHGVAVVRGVWDAADPAVAVERYLEALHGVAREARER
jgi:thiamine-phosphate diphosphorylase